MERTNQFGQPVGAAVEWTSPAPLQWLTTTGHSVAVAPLDPNRHTAGLCEALGPDPAQWTHLPYDAPTCDDDRGRPAPVHDAWLEGAAAGQPAFRLSEAASALWNEER